MKLNKTNTRGIHNIFADSPDEGAAIGLCALMSGISEGYYCAGWMTNLEYELWEAHEDMDYGMGVITKRQSDLLKLLSKECNGWISWVDGELRYVPMDIWLKHLETKDQ